MKFFLRTLSILMISTPAWSQDVEMADGLRSEGKIYVVVGILLLIVVGMITYLVVIDRKASRLEKKLDQNRPA
jgi:type VI protein secretion system component VasF